MANVASRATWVLVVALVLAACGGATATPTPTPEVTPPPTATPVPTPKPTPTPEPTPDIAAIGAAYLAMAAEFNATIGPIMTAFGSEVPLEEWQALAQGMIDAYDAAIADLDAIEFPPELTDQAAGLRAGYITARDEFVTALGDPDYDPFPGLEAAAEAYGLLADEIRAFLGLPARPTNPPG